MPTQSFGQLGQHISKKFNTDLEKLRENVLVMGGMVEEQLKNSLNSLVEGDIELAKQVIKGDSAINQKQLEIDQRCAEILALRQPTASDLRLILCVSKSVADLERIGDLSQYLAKMGKKLADKGYSMRYYADIQHMGRQAQKMLASALDAFARLDADAAIETMKIEMDLDAEFKKLSRQLATYMMEDPSTIRKTLKMLGACSSLERIGDHCENLCEYTLYLVLGEDVRYRAFDEIRNKMMDSAEEH